MYARRAYIPIEHLTAEMAAFPLSSLASLELGVTTLDLSQEETRRLWRAAEGALIQAFPSVSIDELVTLRDHTWFPHGPDATPLASVVRCQARRLLALAPGCNEHEAQRRRPSESALPHRPGSDQVAARSCWRWFTLSIPEDLLLAWLPGSSTKKRLELVTPPLQRLLEEGFAEPHLHLGAALDFSTFWCAAMYAMAEAGIKRDAFAAPGAAADEGRNLGEWLIRTAIARCVLADFLTRSSGSFGLVFSEFAQSRMLPTLRSQAGAGQTALLMEALDDLAAGQLSTEAAPFAVLRSLYAELTGISSWGGRRPSDSISSLDPVHFVLGRSGRLICNPEGELCRAGFEYLVQHDDKDFARLFFQVIRVRNIFYRHVTQRPLTPGLQWFIRFFSRLKPVRSVLSLRSRVACALGVCGIDRGLRSLEIRAAPDANKSEIWRLVQEVDRVQRELARYRAHLIPMGGTEPANFGVSPSGREEGESACQHQNCQPGQLRVLVEPESPAPDQLRSRWVWSFK